jgi:hypothetical protein
MQIAQASGLTAVKGAPVYINSSGQIASTPSTGTAPATTENVASGGVILGFLQEDGASDSSNTSKVGVNVALPGMMFKGQLVTSSALAVTAQTHVGASGGLARISGDTHWGVSTNPADYCLFITELVDPIGTCGGLVGFVIRNSYLQMGVG